MVGMYVSGKLCVENVFRGPYSRFIAWPTCRSCILCPSVNGTWAVLKFRCLLAVEMASLAADVSAPPGPAACEGWSGPAASRKSDADKLAMHLKSCWKPRRCIAADTD